MFSTRVKKKKWFKYAAVIIMISAAIVVLSSCGFDFDFGIGPGLSDWQYDLPNGRSVWHVNSRDICLMRYFAEIDDNGNPVTDDSGNTIYDTSGGSVEIDGYITAFQYGERMEHR